VHANWLASEAARLAVPYFMFLGRFYDHLDVQVAPPKLTIKLTECTNSAQAAYAQACIHELHVPDYRDEQGSCISAAELKDVLLVSFALFCLSACCCEVHLV